MKAYPTQFLTVFWWTQTLLLLTGLLLLPMMLQTRLEWDVPEFLLPASRVGVAAAHTLVAFGAMMVFGMLLPLHVRHGLRQRHNKRTGWWLVAIYALLTLTAWVIFYSAQETLVLTASLLHVVIGLTAVVGLIIHVILGRRVIAMRHAHLARGGRSAKRTSSHY